VQFAIFGNTSWKVEVATEIFASVENTPDEMLPAVMDSIVVILIVTPCIFVESL